MKAKSYREWKSWRVTSGVKNARPGTIADGLHSSDWMGSCTCVGIAALPAAKDIPHGVLAHCQASSCHELLHIPAESYRLQQLGFPRLLENSED